MKLTMGFGEKPWFSRVVIGAVGWFGAVGTKGKGAGFRGDVMLLVLE
jgi:hypothetical protein